MSCYNFLPMFPESDLMAQARRALREERLDDAQGILVSIVVREPANDEAWLLLAESLTDPARKMECLERARRIDPRNPATLRAIRLVREEIAQQASGQAPPVPEPPAAVESPPPAATPPPPDLTGPLLERADAMAQAIILSIEPTATRVLGPELVNMVEQAHRQDERRARRWARTAGRDALVKYEKTLTLLITNLPQNDPQLVALREARQRALDLFK